MKTLLRSRLVLGVACFALLGAITYACKNFLDTPAQGTLSYTYSAASNLINARSSNANGLSVIYNYDGLNRLQSVTDNNLAETQNVTNYGYGGAPPVTGHSATSPATTPTRAPRPPTNPVPRKSSSTTGRPVRRPTTWTRNGPRFMRALSAPTRHCDYSNRYAPRSRGRSRTPSRRRSRGRRSSSGPTTTSRPGGCGATFRTTTRRTPTSANPTISASIQSRS